MVGWQHLLNGRKFEQALGVLIDREAWSAAVPGVAKSWTGLSNELNRALGSPVVEVWCPNVWTTREFPFQILLI